MGYFSNGTEGMAYQEEYCFNCQHEQDDEKVCAVWDAHMLYNYEECNKKESILHVLIPRNEQGYNEQCRMYLPMVELPTNPVSASKDKGE